MASEPAGQPAVTSSAADPLTEASSRRRSARNFARQQKVAERVAAASDEVAGGIGETAAAAVELRQSMELIAAGSQEAAGAAQESLSAMAAVAAALGRSRQQAEQTQQRTDALQAFLIDLGGQIEAAVAGITAGADQQIAQVSMIVELERQADAVGRIVGSVGEIADQTNLLALNAAIEASRAGAEGRSFAVVADEIRTLADRTDSGARDIQAIVGDIQGDVRRVTEVIGAAAAAARADAGRGTAAAAELANIRSGMSALAAAGRNIVLAAVEADRGAREAQRGAEQIAAAAEQQAAAAAEALQAVAQQTAALEQSQAAAQELAKLADGLRGTGDVLQQASGSQAAGVAIAAEQLSSTVQEISGSAAEIMAAINQIEGGVQQQMAATAEASAAASQIESGARAAVAAAESALEQTVSMGELVANSRTGIDALIAGSSAAASRSRETLAMLAALERRGRRIERIVGGIETIAVQISMLAVSGAVEAARAGDSGAGFAQVSGDIKLLAADATADSGRIRDTIEAMQDQVAAARQDFEQLATSLGAEAARTRQLPAALARVSADIEALRAANEDVRRGSEAIFGAVRDLSQGAREISTAAQQASQAASEAASAARQQARGAEELAAAIEEIASLADSLQDADG